MYMYMYMYVYTMYMTFGGFITLVHSSVLSKSYPVNQGRDTFTFVSHLKIRPAQLSCLGSSVGRTSA